MPFVEKKYYRRHYYYDHSCGQFDIPFYPEDFQLCILVTGQEFNISSFLDSEDHVMLKKTFQITVPRLHPSESDRTYFLKEFCLPENSLHSERLEHVWIYNSIDRQGSETLK